jgi:hypothetical protein
MFRAKRAESPYDLIVDMPTRTSEKLVRMGDRVVLCETLTLIQTDPSFSYLQTLEISRSYDVKGTDNPVQRNDHDHGADKDCWLISTKSRTRKALLTRRRENDDDQDCQTRDNAIRKVQQDY